MTGEVRIARNRRCSALDAHAQPAARVPPGSIVEFETSDEPYEQLARGISLDLLPIEQFNQVTGPLAVEGVVPGDTLRVDILDIHIERAWLVFLRAFGPLGRWLPETFCWELPIEGHTLVVSPRVRLPLQPSIGCIGLAPKHGRSSTFRPVWPWGGNLDLPELRPGSTIWLPVQRPEAFLFIGDVHAAIGAGEPAHVGIEAAARVRVRVDRVTGLRCPAPRLRTEHELIFVGIGETIPLALRRALEHALEALRVEYKLTPPEAYGLVCGCLSYRFGGPAGPVVLASLPVAVLDQLSGTATPS